MAEFDPNLEAAQQRAYDAILRHALAVERNTRGMTADVKRLIDDAGSTLAQQLNERLENLSPGDLAALSRYQQGQRISKLPSRVQGVIKLIDEWAQSLGANIQSSWQSDAVEFIQQELDFNRDLFDSIMRDPVTVSASAKAIYRQAMQTPVLGKFVESSLRDESLATQERVYATIRNGVAQGQTNNEIIKALRGTKYLDYRDGVLNTTRNNLSSIVRTGRSHLSNETNETVYEALGLEQVVFVATIDGRTTLRCSSLDQSTYDRNSNYPKPPLHWGCRSIIAPYFGGKIMGNRPYVKAFKPIGRIRKDDRPADMVGQVRASTSMTGFLRRPDNAAFARQYFGPKRYELFKSGKLSVKQMVRADGTRYSLSELRTQHRKDFAEVFG
ncbi:hypothetical protein [Vreelandella populi]|uniref:hypothetical protein n=1 Tax=Vreelandella populi TaxID=2498858 RepID=UPI000F8F1635|nr:hypothetical protein [Halomonas populi]RUR52704.1 hypothetical protein ELY40_11680 [Halomonas populi]